MKKIALVGNPNSGKSSVFNQLTGLNQHIGNYPGVTVDRKTGTCQLENKQSLEVIDLPGTYSIYPRSEDERVVYDLLRTPEHQDFPDLIVVIIDAANIERNLLLFTQVYDLRIPVILGLNMMDVAHRDGLLIDTERLSELLGGVPIVTMNARKGEGIKSLKKAITDYEPPQEFVPFHQDKTETEVADSEAQICETQERYQKIRQVVRQAVRKHAQPVNSLTRRLDAIFVHPIGGYLIFFGLLFLMFQAIYSLAELPMNLIDEVFLTLSQWVKTSLPAGVFTDLLAEGVVPGIGGVVIFVPQIVILFAFITLLEETGYMARAVFIMDRLMRPFGLNGKSVVPLISGLACAIPAVMATRTIGNWKDRLITIMVTPLMSCSARLPVYTLLIALVIPDTTLLGIFNLRGLTLLGLYLLGLFAALGVAMIFQRGIKHLQPGFLVMELPRYKTPRWGNIGITLWEKTRLFIFEAGKVILAISIVLWVLASYGPGNRMEEAVAALPEPVSTATEEEKTSYEEQVNAVRLENSWVGLLGKQIEPVIRPLGYDWKIGIALITSFAAREVFVGSMATIYSVGEDFEENESLLERMRTEVNPQTGKPVYTLASGLSLMVFYVFAMQCMSTLAIVRRETKSWKWPLIQLVYMTALAYGAAWATFVLF